MPNQNGFHMAEPARTAQTVKVLAVGNSFSQDATTYLRSMALADGVDFRVANLFIGGCSLERHYNNTLSGAKDYLLTYYTPDLIYDLHPVDLTFALEAADWDFITVQQVSGNSGKYETFEPFAAGLIRFIRQHCPQAEILLHQTWAYQSDYPGIISNGYGTQEKMYLNIREAYEQFSADYGNARIIPSGEAWHKARATAIGDNLNRDGFHGNIKGRLLAGWVWYETFTGISPLESRYDAKTADPALTDEEIGLLKQAAHDAFLEYRAG